MTGSGGTGCDVDLSVVIVSFNTRDLLLRCLESLYPHPAGLRLEVFVVDNASTDGSVEMVKREFPSVELLVNDSNVGFAQANNQALALATGRHRMLLNSDAAVLPGAIRALVDHLDTSPETGIVGPQLLNPDGSVQPSGNRAPTLGSEIWWSLSLYRLARRKPASRYFDPRRDYSAVTSVEEVSGACMAVRSAVLDQIGLLDESFFFGFEDVDLCIRVRRAGWSVTYCPAAQVIHAWGGSTSGVGDRFAARYAAAQFHYLGKHYGRSSEVLMRGLTACKALLRIPWIAIRHHSSMATLRRAQRNNLELVKICFDRQRRR